MENKVIEGPQNGPVQDITSIATSTQYMPHALIENDDFYLIKFHIPGVGDKKQVGIEIEDNDRSVTITAEGKGGFATVYSAIWKEGPLHCEKNGQENQIKKVALKCLNNSQNIINEFLNEIKANSMSIYGNILKIYGISQNPESNDYIIVLEVEILMIG
ncbi:hypothetical protein C1645_829523 [Glomus cerebriforme]|uniref:Protein kinase domain-containing protein n=1 Tax=Glomus cerebriforme TaxID=658196 RepID=A0A397SMY5_9GLOM|nr:hypothetical protein C1645_829523 [Glomus cerebriforme]